jgi:arylformamidase
LCLSLVRTAAAHLTLFICAVALCASEAPRWRDISVAVVPGKLPRMSGETPTRFNGSNTRVDDRYEVKVSESHSNAHTGTHIDAPIHLIPHTESVDQISFDRLIGPARIIECSQDARVIELRELNLHNWKGARRLLFTTRNSYANL